MIGKDLVAYDSTELVRGKKYRIKLVMELPENYKERVCRTVKNLNRMLDEGHSVVVISPVRILTKEEMESYRKFFCSYAKKERKNMVYFPGPVVIREG